MSARIQGLLQQKVKNDKNISGLISSIGETKLSIYTFTNALALDAGEEKQSIINMEFASGDETNAEFHAQAIMEVESNPDTRTLTAETTIDLGPTTDDEGNEVEKKKVISFPLSWNEDGKTALSVFYVLDGHEVEEFHPKESWLSGKHLLTLYYPIIGLTANQLHTFEVLISMKNGTGHIEAQNIMATITRPGTGCAGTLGWTDHGRRYPEEDSSFLYDLHMRCMTLLRYISLHRKRQD